MQLFDTHFHYSGESTPADYLAQEPAAAGMLLLATGDDYDSSCRCRDFAAAIPRAAFTVGVHPHAAEEPEHDFSEFRNHPKLKAVGELGLDYYYDYAPRTAQRRVFERFLALALEWNLPAVVHCRDAAERFDAYADCRDLLRDFAAAGGRFDLHCFAGTPQWAETFLELGAMLGVTGMVTFKPADNIRAALRLVPDDRLLLETDAPYLAPVPLRGKPNHPGYLIHTARRVAAERGMEPEALAAIATANGKRFFNMEDF